MPLRKGATFHSPSSPSSSDDDPILNVRSLPRRSPTSPQALEDLVAASEDRVASIIASFDRSFSGLSSNIGAELNHKDILPVPKFFLAHVASEPDRMDVDDIHVDRATRARRHSKLSKLVAAPVNHHHTSDSGIGSSVSESVCEGPRPRVRQCMFPTGVHHPSLTNSPEVTNARSTTSVYSSLTRNHTAITKSFTAISSSKEGNVLSCYAIKQIKKHIVDPILADETFKEYHPLIEDIPHRIGDRAITCLRDLEKTLIFLAPVSADFSAGEGVLAYCFLRLKSRSKSADTYRIFCETSIQCIHTTVDHLNEIDQRRPTDRPYTNNYFLDLVEQVRQYARIMAITRQREAEGKKLTDLDYSPLVSDRADDSFPAFLLTYIRGEKIHLTGGISKNGCPAELVREKDGKMMSIDAGRDAVRPDAAEDHLVDEESIRSMARKRKCDIGKEEWRACRDCGKDFKRPCDLTKHEKTHSRPWKCSEHDCKYHEEGWPTEKERDRHVNDKHMDDPALFKCLFKPCAYTSKRESNCKQHMEKAHGWEYVRSKSKKSKPLIACKPTPPATFILTPNSTSAFPSLSTPATPSGSSYASSSNHAWSPVGSLDGLKSNSLQSSVRCLHTVSNSFASPVEFTGQSDAAFNFNDYGHGWRPNGEPSSPWMAEARRETVDTPDTGFTYSPTESAPPPNDFEQNFSLGEFYSDHTWPPVVPFFPQYSNVQQPTPAWSDMHCDFDAFGTNQQHTLGLQGTLINHPLTPGAQPDLMFSAMPEHGALYNDDEGFEEQPKDDFILFRETSTTGPVGGESSAMGAMGSMFPELESVGGQFGQDPMCNDIDDGALEKYTNFGDFFTNQDE